MSKQNPGQPQRRKPGRPRYTAEERAAAQARKDAAKERRIPPSYQGRLKFRPGDKHVLDIQFKEARNYRGLLAAEIEHLQATQATLAALDDPGVLISQEENALKAFLWETYKEHKHRDHIAATFLAIRRQRLLARLQAADAALRIAIDLLQPDDTLLHDLRRAVEHLRQETAQREQQPRTQPPASQDDEATQEEEDQEPTPINSRHIYGDLKMYRAQLAQFDAQVQEIRAAISPAIGWFEEYYVKKTRYTAAAREYVKRNEPIPPDVQEFEDVYYGPYLKYRTQEETGGPQYTVQMSLIPEEELLAAKVWAAILNHEENEGPPWQNL